MSRDYSHVRADPRKRRTGYVWLIILAFLVFAASLVDIMFLDSVMELGVYGAYALLFIIGIILLFTRRTGEKSEFEEVTDDGWGDLGEQLFLRCQSCKHIFRYTDDHPGNEPGTSFQCPMCGVYSTMPPDGVDPKSAIIPEEDPVEMGYRCLECGEHITVTTFGEDDHHEIRFRNCPNCARSRSVVRADEYDERIQARQREEARARLAEREVAEDHEAGHDGHAHAT